MRRLKLKNAHHAQATLEMLVVLIVLVPLLFGGIELARAISLRHSLDSGAFTAARVISLTPDDLTTARSIVQDSVTQNVFAGGNIANANYGTVTWDTCPNGHVLGCRFIYTATIDYTPWIPIIGGQPIVITIRHHGIVDYVN